MRIRLHTCEWGGLYKVYVRVGSINNRGVGANAKHRSDICMYKCIYLLKYAQVTMKQTFVQTFALNDIKIERNYDGYTLK